MYDATIHSKNVGRERVHKLFYGINTSGPRGGHIGNAVDARDLTGWYAGSYYKAPEWMYRALEYLQQMQLNPEDVHLMHDDGSKYSIINGVRV